MELYKQMAAQTRWHSFENTTGGKGAGGRTNHGAKGDPCATVKAGETVTLMDAKGAGRITRMWLTTRERSPYMLRAFVLRMYWDGEEKPAVEMPLGDFFCVGGPMEPFENELFASPEGRSFVCYAPMPFQTGARVTFTNESSMDLSLLFYDIDWLALPEPDKDALYFHACWRRDAAAAPGEDFVVLPRVTGAGRFLGMSVAVIPNRAYGQTWWGEGEVKMYIDGDAEFPTLCGTGAEDYIGTGWGQKVFKNRYQGCLHADWELPLFSFYRLHVPDPVLFTQDIQVSLQRIGGADVSKVREIADAGAALIPITSQTPDGTTTFMYKTDLPLPESGWINFYRQDDYAAAAWFYLDAPVSELPALAPLAERALVGADCAGSF